MATEYAGRKIVTDGLVLCLDAADRNSYVSGSTTWNSVAGNNLSGSLINGPTFGSNNGGAITFDGTNDYFIGSSGSYASVGSGPFTHDVWFYQPTTLGFTGSFGGKYGVLFSGNAQSTFECFLYDNITGSGVPSSLIMGSYGGGTIGSVSGVGIYSFPIQTWHNVTITRNVTGNILVYKNTSIIATGSLTNNFANAPLYLAGAPINSLYAAYVNIRYGSFKSYNRALSASEVLQNFNAQKSRFGL
jgi:hypothetical protein